METVGENLGGCAVRPYRLRNPIQHYAWGMRGPDAFLPAFLGIRPDEETPYAELWIGAHTSSPSQIFLEDGRIQALDAHLGEHAERLLGQACLERFGPELPFLLKVLSAGQPLSIQAHPNPHQAARLHRQNPKFYPDEKAKPEIAIALDHLVALAGFRPIPALMQMFRTHPEIHDILEPGEKLTSVADWEQGLESCIHRLLTADPLAGKSRADHLTGLYQRLRILGEEAGFRDNLFMDLYEQYGAEDIGLVFLFLLNRVELKTGEAILLEPGMPHAYLQGNIIECMANSDNVVRAGLTPKPVDLPALREILRVCPGEISVLKRPSKKTTYQYPLSIPEFGIRHTRLQMDEECEVTDGKGPRLVLVMGGTLNLHWQSGTAACCVHLQRSQSLFLPHELRSFTFHASTASEFFEVFLPEGDL